MFKKILYPVDFSDFAEEILEYAVAMATEFGAELHLLHVIPNLNYFTPYESFLTPENMVAIEQNIEAARKDLKTAWESYQSSRIETLPHRECSEYWERSQSAFKEKLIALNKRIRDYNIQVPNARFQRPVLNFDQELKKITSL